MFKKALLAGAAAFAIGALAAVAQTITMPQVPNIGQSDLVRVIQNGMPKAPAVYAKTGQIVGAPGVKLLNDGADAVGGTYTYTQVNGVTWVLAYTSDAITKVTITTDANPSDGERLCYMADGAATTSLVFTANTGQTIKPTISAGVSDTAICLTYVKSLGAWYRS